MMMVLTSPKEQTIHWNHFWSGRYHRWSPWPFLIQGPCGETYHLDRCMPLVGRTLEILEFWHISGHLMIPFVSDKLNPDTLPSLRSLGFKEIYGPLDLPIVVGLLYRFDKLCTAAFVSTFGLFLDETETVHTSGIPREDTIRGHLSRLVQKGLDVYLGTDERNYLSIDEAK
ncbi:hypothetical protein MSAN_01489600 [Mycena sanguinolenta]|uniref:Uncharacterized protein n=1 Tax=Mycena sanguinolenta TaxID=230812 RepID=A0A8H6YC31_9AGAR|nr:hypothetical protein MSAN_01489600 [Mycena sanguinolenta]